MTSKLNTRIENEILMCFITGDRSSHGSLSYWHELIERCQREGILYILLTIALRGKFHPIDAIETYQAIIKLLKPTGIHISVVDLNHMSANDTQVATNMGASQGLNVAFFNKEEEALRWLNDKKNNHENSLPEAIDLKQEEMISL